MAIDLRGGGGAGRGFGLHQTRGAVDSRVPRRGLPRGRAGGALYCLATVGPELVLNRGGEGSGSDSGNVCGCWFFHRLRGKAGTTVQRGGLCVLPQEGSVVTLTGRRAENGSRREMAD